MYNLFTFKQKALNNFNIHLVIKQTLFKTQYIKVKGTYSNNIQRNSLKLKLISIICDPIEKENNVDLAEQ